MLDVAPNAKHLAKLVYNGRVTSNNLKYGGIHPLRTMESHHANIAKLVWKAMISTEGVKPDLVAVTKGPGMRNNLQAGIDVAKGLSVAWGKPLVGVHHMHAHALSLRLHRALSDPCGHSVLEQKATALPYLSLLVSGGHTLLVHSESVTKHRILASTTDIAIGDCLDKIARLVLPQEIINDAADVSYGKLLEAFAFGSTRRSDGSFSPVDSAAYAYDPPTTISELIDKSTTPNKYGWYVPTPFLKKGLHNATSDEFSFAGIVAHVKRIVLFRDYKRDLRSEPMPTEEARALARAAMEAAFEHLAHKVALHINILQPMSSPDADSIVRRVAAGDQRRQIRSLALAGGVAANKFLRHVLKAYLARHSLEPEVHVLPADLCTDNAPMIAWAAAEMVGATAGDVQLRLPKPGVGLEMRALRKWSLENLMTPEVEEAREAREEQERDQKQLEKAAVTISMQEEQGETAAGAETPQEKSGIESDGPVGSAFTELLQAPDGQVKIGEPFDLVKEVSAVAQSVINVSVKLERMQGSMEQLNKRIAALASNQAVALSPKTEAKPVMQKQASQVELVQSLACPSPTKATSVTGRKEQILMWIGYYQRLRHRLLSSLTSDQTAWRPGVVQKSDGDHIDTRHAIRTLIGKLKAAPGDVRAKIRWLRLREDRLKRRLRMLRSNPSAEEGPMISGFDRTRSLIISDLIKSDTNDPPRTVTAVPCQEHAQDQGADTYSTGLNTAPTSSQDLEAILAGLQNEQCVSVERP